MDRLGQLRGESEAVPDSSGASSVVDPFVTADSSKYFSLSDGDTSVESPSTTRTTDLVSSLSPIPKNNDLSGYKIGEQIEAANILSGGVDIFDDDNSNDDGLVIDDNPMQLNEEKSVSQEIEECKQRGSESTGEDTLVPSETTVQIKEAEIQNTEITLNIDGKNVNAIDIGNDLYLYRLEEGEQQGDLAAVQILNSNQEQPTFKFLKVRWNDEGNLEVYEEIIKEIAEERRKLPVKDVKKDVVSIKNDKSLIKDSKVEKKADAAKPLKFGSDARKSPIGSFTPFTFHSTPIKEGVPLTKTMVDLHLQTSINSDITKKTIEVNTDGCKLKPTEQPKNDTIANNQIYPPKTMKSVKQTDKIDLDKVKITSSETPQEITSKQNELDTKVEIIEPETTKLLPGKLDTSKDIMTSDDCKIDNAATKVKNVQESPIATECLMDSIIDKERALNSATSHVVDDNVAQNNLEKNCNNKKKLPTNNENVSSDRVDEKTLDTKIVVKEEQDKKVDDSKNAASSGSNDNKDTGTVPIEEFIDAESAGNNDKKYMKSESVNELCLHNSDTICKRPESKDINTIKPDKIEIIPEAISKHISDSDKKQLSPEKTTDIIKTTNINDNNISELKEKPETTGTELKNTHENKLPKELHVTSNSKLVNEIKPKSLNNNNNNAVPFGQWTEANKQEYLNKIKDYKTSTSNSSSNQIKQTNDLNRRDFHLKMDGKFAGLSKNEVSNTNKTSSRIKQVVSKPEKVEPVKKNESNDRSDILNFKDLIDKAVEGMLMDKPSNLESKPKPENVKEKSTSNTLVSDIELKMNELHGKPFVERPSHKLPSRFQEDRKKYDKVAESKVSKPANARPSCKIPNLLPLSNTIQIKDKEDLISEEDILDYPPVTGDSDPVPIITEKDFDKFARRNSVTYERQVTVKFDAKKKPSIVHTAVEKTNLSNPIIAKPYKQQYFGKPPVAIKSTNKEPENKTYSSNIKLAYHSALTAKRQKESPITVIEDKPVKVVYMENSNEFGPYNLNVQGQELTSKSDQKPTSDVEMLSSCDSSDDIIAEPKKHQRKQDLTVVDAPDLELIEPTDLGITIKRKRKTTDLHDHANQSKRSSKNVPSKKSYLMTRKVEDDLPTYKANTSLNTIDSLVMAAELLEKQPDVAKAIVETNTKCQDLPVKRGRGRPRKNPLPGEDSANTTLNNTTSPKAVLDKKRERSITSISDLSATLDSSDDEEHQENWTMGKINENIVCPICSKLFRSENVVFKHVKHCTGPSPNRSESSRTRSRGPGADKSDSSAEDSSEPAAKEDDDASLQSIKNMLDKKQARLKAAEAKKSKIPTSSQNSQNSNNVCETCGKAFRQLSYLVNHRLLHTKEVPKESTKETKNVLSCKICNKEFRKLHHLAQHRITHRNMRNMCEGSKSSTDTAKTSADTPKSSEDTGKTTGDSVKILADTTKNSADTAKISASTVKNSTETAKTTSGTSKSLADASKFPANTVKRSADSAKITSATSNSLTDITKTSSSTIKTSAGMAKTTSGSSKRLTDTNKTPVSTVKSSTEIANSSSGTSKSLLDTSKSSAMAVKSSADTVKTSSGSRKTSVDTNKTFVTKAAVVGVDGRTSKASTEEHDKSVAIRCEQCQKTFRKLHHLAEHRETHSGISKTKAANINTEVEKASSPPPPTCNICNKSFRKLHHLSEHKDNKCEGKKGTFAAKELIHECPLCYMVFPNEHSLEKHTISCRRKKRQAALKQAKELNAGEATTDQDLPAVVDDTVKTEKDVTNLSDEDHNTKSQIDPSDSTVESQQHNVPEPQTRTSKRHFDDSEAHYPIKVKKLDEVKGKTPNPKDESKPTSVKKLAKKVEEVKPATKQETEVGDVKPEVKEERDRKDLDVKNEPENVSQNKKVDTSVIELSDDDDEDVRYMFNPDFREREFHKVNSQKRNSLTLDRAAGKSSTKRRISLQQTSRASRTPSTSVPAALSQDDDIKYSFPKTKRKDDKPKVAANTSKVTQPTVPVRRKSQPKVVKKPLPKKEPVPAHRCDCGQLFGSGALLARHATLVHTPPRRTIHRTLPPQSPSAQTKPNTLKPRRTLTRK